jgi:hypothetical protein
LDTSTRVTGAPDSAGRGFVFVLVCMLGGQALGTTATMTLPAVGVASGGHGCGNDVLCGLFAGTTRTQALRQASSR